MSQVSVYQLRQDMNAEREPGVALERRGKPRLYEPFPTIVRGVDSNGESFEVNTTLDNISASGLYVRLNRQVDTGAMLTIIVRLSTSKSKEVRAPLVELKGRVGRVEGRCDSLYGVVLCIAHHRFLWDSVCHERERRIINTNEAWRAAHHIC